MNDLLDYQKRQRRPGWVSVGLAGLPSRAWASGFFWFSVSAAALSAVLGFFFPAGWFGLLFLSAAWWYRASIRWMDRNHQW